MKLRTITEEQTTFGYEVIKQVEDFVNSTSLKPGAVQQILEIISPFASSLYKELKIKSNSKNSKSLNLNFVDKNGLTETEIEFEFFEKDRNGTKSLKMTLHSTVGMKYVHRSSWIYFFNFGGTGTGYSVFSVYADNGLLKNNEVDSAKRILEKMEISAEKFRQWYFDLCLHFGIKSVKLGLTDDLEIVPYLGKWKTTDNANYTGEIYNE
jgi:hypothetical protein